MPARREGRQLADHPLHNLQDDSDDDCTNQHIIGSNPFRINKLCFCQNLTSKEIQITEGEEHKQNSTGITNDSCGLLSVWMIIRTQLSMFFKCKIDDRGN